MVYTLLAETSHYINRPCSLTAMLLTVTLALGMTVGMDFIDCIDYHY